MPNAFYFKNKTFYLERAETFIQMPSGIIKDQLIRLVNKIVLKQEFKKQ